MDEEPDKETPKKRRHLKMIREAIKGLAHNSFLLKGWTAILVCAFFGFAVMTLGSPFTFLACLPALVFWFLDGYFLRQQKLFKALYEHVREKDEENIDFSMDVSEVEETREVSYLSGLFSRTLITFHGAVLGSIVFVSTAMLVAGI